LLSETRQPRSGGGTKCGVCHKEYNAALYQQKRLTVRYKEQVRENHLQRAYGLSIADFERMLDEQNHQCPICERQLHLRVSKGTPSFAVVDHCHTTGKVRGLMCNNCNTGIGLLNEDSERFLAAIAYLDKHK
jgi:hypothetical protein